MKKLMISILIAGMLIFGMSMGVLADTTEDSTAVSIDVDAIATLSVGETESFTITCPTTPGDAPVVGGEGTTTTLAYTSVVTSGDSNKITAQMGTGLIPGLTLNIACGSIDATGNGTPTSFDLNGTSAQDFVTAIGSGYATGVQITYDLTISDITSVVADDSTSNNRVVTFTILATP